MAPFVKTDTKLLSKTAVRRSAVASGSRLFVNRKRPSTIRISKESPGSFRNITSAWLNSPAAVSAMAWDSSYQAGSCLLYTSTTLKAEGLVPVSLGLGLEAGVGKKKVFALYLGGNMDFDFKWFPWKTGTGTVTFAAGGGLYVFGQKLGVNYKFDPILMFDTTKSGFSSDYSEETPSREAVESVQTPNFDFDFSETDTGGLQAAGVTLLEGVLHDRCV